METITFNKLRKIKQALPDGSIKKIAEQLNITPDSVRNYFGGNHFSAQIVGIHYEQGPDGGIVSLDDDTILNLARKILDNSKV
ncbi:MAG: DNA-binding protein [Bacteroidales bacterium]